MVPGASYSASGGDAASENGDSVFTNQTEFGGLNYKTGVSPLLIGVGVVAVVGLLLVMKK